MTPIEQHRNAIRARLREWDGTRPGPGDISWRINREMIVVAAWGRAVLLQLAHPLVAAGVGEHSRFSGGLTSGVARLRSTVGAMLALTFGNEDAMVEAAARINAIHDRVRGQLAESAGRFAAGCAYSAHDAELLRWVHATLMDSIPRIYEQLVAPVMPAEREQYLAEAAIMGPLLGIPDTLLPRTVADLDSYVSSMVDTGTLGVTSAGRRLAHGVLFPRGWQLLWPLFRPFQLMTIGTLPPRIRAAYGFSWTARDERALVRWTRTLRGLLRLTSPVVRHWPVSRTHAALTPQRFIAPTRREVI